MGGVAGRALDEGLNKPPLPLPPLPFIELPKRPCPRPPPLLFTLDRLPRPRPPCPRLPRPLPLPKLKPGLLLLLLLLEALPNNPPLEFVELPKRPVPLPVDDAELLKRALALLGGETLPLPKEGELVPNNPPPLVVLVPKPVDPDVPKEAKPGPLGTGLLDPPEPNDGPVAALLPKLGVVDDPNDGAAPEPKLGAADDPNVGVEPVPKPKLGAAPEPNVPLDALVDPPKPNEPLEVEELAAAAVPNVTGVALVTPTALPNDTADAPETVVGALVAALAGETDAANPPPKEAR